MIQKMKTNGCAMEQVKKKASSVDVKVDKRLSAITKELKDGKTLT